MFFFIKYQTDPGLMGRRKDLRVAYCQLIGYRRRYHYFPPQIVLAFRRKVSSFFLFLMISGKRKRVLNLLDLMLVFFVDLDLFGIFGLG
ncbi:BnaA08g04990D [Brassica napus]|uniref:BnaA08g04990D protein n=1 Tax=Brassica napus TaxID=3708 RepID=A0A078HAS4_BRANA|nr:BnaA08g04990D [Brassica napus]